MEVENNTQDHCQQVVDVQNDEKADSISTNTEMPPSEQAKPAKKCKKSKTKLCYEFMKTGTCRFANCRFAHGLEDMKGNQKNPEHPKPQFNELLRNQSEIRQSVRQRAELSKKMNDIDYEQSRMCTSCMIDRYFTQMFCANIHGNIGEDQYVNMHSNKICIIGVGFGHIMFKNNEIATKVEFLESREHLSLLNPNVQGKKKRGGIWLEDNEPICTIETNKGNTYTMYSCMRGRVVEANLRLLKEPELVTSKPRTEGYLLIMIPKQENILLIQQSLLTSEDYIHILKQRKEIEQEKDNNNNNNNIQNEEKTLEVIPEQPSLNEE
ncbi:hypothetical protein WA158_000719 [Blastocystis sp. Blastoise]